MTGEKPKIRREEIEQIKSEIEKIVLEYVSRHAAYILTQLGSEKTEIWRTIGYGNICPNCLERFRAIKIKFHTSNIYVYLSHSKVRKCYYGALTYKYVSRTHNDSGLTLKGPVYTERYVEYISAISQHIREIEDIEVLKNLEKALEEALVAVRRQIEILS